MATTLKTLRALRTQLPTIARRNYTGSPFKEPWEYPASARESVQSFREAKVEFNEPVTGNLSKQTVRDSAALKLSVGPNHDAAFETSKLDCPWNFMTYNDAKRSWATEKFATSCASSQKVKEEDRGEKSNDSRLGSWLRL